MVITVLRNTQARSHSAETARELAECSKTRRSAKLGRLCLSETKGREPNRLYAGGPLLKIAVRDGENKRAPSRRICVASFRRDEVMSALGNTWATFYS